MRHKLGNYQDRQKHRFSAKMVRYGSYKDRTTGKDQTTILFTELKDEEGTLLTDHVWVREDSYMKTAALKQGRIYTFEAKVGTYNRGRTASDYQISKVRQISVA